MFIDLLLNSNMK